MGRKKWRRPALPQVAQRNQPANPPSTPTAPPTFQTHITGVQYSGPIPPPAMLGEYDKIVPGAADRMLKMAELQEAHRHSLEKAHVHGNLISQYVGQVSGLLIGLAGIGSGTFLLYSGRSLEGFGAMFGPLAGLAAVFLIGRWRQERERREKLERVDRTGRSA